MSGLPATAPQRQTSSVVRVCQFRTHAWGDKRIVKADDVGVALAKNDSGSITGRMTRAVGRALVLGMPSFLTFLGAAGTAAMIWVGGGIIVHGLEAYGAQSLGRASSAVGLVSRSVAGSSGCAQLYRR
jgi:predicted DNA repair protein MutK